MNLRVPNRFDGGPCRARGRRGLLLVEVLVYLGVAALVTSLAVTTFFKAVDYARHLNRNANDITRALQAGERWRDTLRHATGAPTLVAEDGALRIPQAGGEVVYLFGEQTVFRKAAGDDRFVIELAQVKASRMVREARAHAAAWRWEVELATRLPSVRVRPLFTFIVPAPAAPTP